MTTLGAWTFTDDIEQPNKSCFCWVIVAESNNKVQRAHFENELKIWRDAEGSLLDVMYYAPILGPPPIPEELEIRRALDKLTSREKKLLKLDP
jgi:hypothetical protein